MSKIDRDSICEAYEEVRDDNSHINWFVCKYEGNNIILANKGEVYEDIQELFGDHEAAYAFARITTGDELSKRAKFVFITWAGADLEVLPRAKLSVDKALVQSICQNFALEISAVSQDEVCLKHVRARLDQAGGANYGTGERE